MSKQKLFIVIGIVVLVFGGIVWWLQSPDYIDPDENLTPAAPIGTTRFLTPPSGFKIPEDVNLTDTSAELERIYPPLSSVMSENTKLALLAQLGKRFIYRPISDDIVEDTSYKVTPIIVAQSNFYPAELTVQVGSVVVLLNQSSSVCNLTSSPNLVTATVESQQVLSFDVNERGVFDLLCVNGSSTAHLNVL